MTRPTAAKRRRRRAPARAMAVLPLLLALAAAASAAEPVVVASDGRVYPQVPLAFTSSPPSRGTGVSPDAPATVIRPRRGRRASGTATTESIIATDERRQITDTTGYPYSAIVSLEIAFPNSTGWLCTGFLIDADTVATAGHCVYDAFEGGWATSITAYPGRNGRVAPFGSATATTLFAVSQWTADADPEFDYGAIRISSPLGDAAGWLGYGVKNDDAALLGARVRIFGYPSDKPVGTMWGMAKRLKGVEKHKLFYKADTFGGQSGSPIFGKLSNACRPCAFGVHAYGVGLEPFATSNSGTRVDATVFASLAFWATQ